MAVNVSVFNLENFPNNPKTVSVDLTELVPYGNGGEDAWVFSAVTSATASGGAAIQRLYMNHTKFGYAKSSGLSTGPYDITVSQRHLKVAIDEDIGSGVEVALTVSALPLGGDAVASDLQAKINAFARTGGSKVGNLSYLNAAVHFVNGQFEIISGTAGNLYTGVDRTSVAVADGVTTTGLAAELGFNIPFTSEALATAQVKQTSLASGYTGGAGTAITVTNAGIISTGDCIAITNGTTTDFRGVTTAAGTAITLASGIANSYAAGSLIQVLALRDPSGDPPAIYSRVDDYINFAVNSIVNQIDFSR
jgi:hypothetical protein